MKLYQNLYKLLKLVQSKIFKYYDKKRFEGLDFKKGGGSVAINKKF